MAKEKFNVDKEKFNVDVESRFLGEKYHAEGFAELSNIYPNISNEEVNGRLHDVISAGFLIGGESMVDDPVFQRNWSERNQGFFKIENLDYSKAEVINRYGEKEDLLSSQYEDEDEDEDEIHVAPEMEK